MREVLAQNINRLMEQRYKESSNRPRALAVDAGVSLSTVQRTLSREAGASVDTVESFAKVFGLQAYQLLMPGWLGAAAQPQADYQVTRRPPLFSGARRRTAARGARAARRRTTG